MISLGFTPFFDALLLHNATSMADLIAQGLHFFTHNSCTTVIKIGLSISKCYSEKIIDTKQSCHIKKKS